MKDQAKTIGNWEKVGVIGVDAGLCWVGDPCYILHKKDKPKAIGKDWHAFCDTLYHISDDHTHMVEFNTKQYNYDAGHPGLGVVVSTGYGDGEYDVEVRKTTGGRIAEIRVVFISEDEEPEDDNPEEDSDE